MKTLLPTRPTNRTIGRAVGRGVGMLFSQASMLARDDADDRSARRESACGSQSSSDAVRYRPFAEVWHKDF